MSIQKEVNKFYIITSQVRIENLIDNNIKKVTNILNLGNCNSLMGFKRTKAFF